MNKHIDGYAVPKKEEKKKTTNGRSKKNESEKNKHNGFHWKFLNL